MRQWGVGMCGLVLLPALAAPLTEPEQRERLMAPLPAAESSENPVDVQGWIQRETTAALLDSTVEKDRSAVLQHGWQSRSPTWIQDSAQANLGDFPSLDRTAENAERDLKTLEWVIEEQRRAAAGRAQRAGTGDDASAPEDNWLRRLLPLHWIATLKANREWVAAGGTTLLVIVWGATMFARRPGSRPPPASQAEAPPPRRRRRRHRGAHVTTG